ncbi:hypothetical protein BDR07DRAFT_236314 [Suillus spraguei]|nr:hypothetical protein BDR07DRAFT_236314 [Suillus spraguei]
MTRPRSDERPGTVPFMALDLLTEEDQQGEVKHLYCRDVESFVWCLTWISLRYENGVLLSVETCPFDAWTTLDGVKKYCSQSQSEVPARSHIDPLLWSLVVECFDLLDTDSFNRRNRFLRSMKRREEPANTEETESDIDGFLQRFKDTESWVALSQLPHEPSL